MVRRVATSERRHIINSLRKYFEGISTTSFLGAKSLTFLPQRHQDLTNTAMALRYRKLLEPHCRDGVTPRKEAAIH